MLVSCADSWNSVKRGITGEKQISTDEFLVKKKDPLVLPPDYDNLPTPDERDGEKEDVASFEEKLSKNSTTENASSSDGSAEMSILEQIRRR